MSTEFRWMELPEQVIEAYDRVVLPRTPAPLATQNLCNEPALITGIDLVRQVEAVLNSSINPTIAGMERLMAGMDGHGMLVHVAPRPCPDLRKYGYAGPCGFASLFDIDIPAAAADAIHAWLAQLPPAPGIGSFKLSSSAGWIVTPQECQSAIAILGDRPAPIGIRGAYWEQWIRFVRGAISHGGFRAL